MQSMPASGSYVEGTVYFDESDNLIKVATSTSAYQVFSGVRDATWNASTNVLTITKPNGSALNIDFDSIATITELQTELNGLRAGIGFAADTNQYASDAFNDTSYLRDKTTVIAALKELDKNLYAVQSAAGVVSIGGQSGVITLKNGGSNNGDINLTMNGQQLNASIIGLGTAAYTNSSAYDVSGAAAAVLGSSADASGAKTIYGLDKKIDDLATDSEVTVVKDATAQSGYIASYTISQGGTELGKINIPKDYLVKSGEIKTVTTANVPYQGAVVGDKYLDFTVNTYDTSLGSGTESHIYIPVKELVDVYTAGNTDTISMSLDSSNEFTAVLKDNAVTTAKIADGNVTTAKLDSSVQTALNKANTAIQSVAGETAVANSSYINIAVSSSTNDRAVTLSTTANVVTHDVSTATSSSNGLATAYDVQDYVKKYVAEQLQWAEFHQ